MLIENIVLGSIGLMLFVGFLLKFEGNIGATHRPIVNIKENEYKILKKLWYFEHELYVSSLTNERGPTIDERENLLKKLPEKFHKYIDRQNYINGVKVVHMNFHVYDKNEK